MATFILHDQVEGSPITPQNVELLTLHQFMGEVIDLIQGEFKRSEIGQPVVSIESGSVKLVSWVPLLLAASIHADLERLAQSNDLDAISPKRAEVIENWQARASKPGAKRSYNLQTEIPEAAPILLAVSSETHFRHLQQNLWVNTEKYLRGRVVDLGGKTKPNIHLVLPSGESIKIDASEAQLEGANYLYKSVTLHVQAKEHIHSGNLKDARLIDALHLSRDIDETKLNTLWQHGRKAWADIRSPTDWVEQLRES